MTKKEMISEMIGGEPRLAESAKNAFWNRALAKNKEWMSKLYEFYKKDIVEHPIECRNFCFALLNK